MNRSYKNYSLIEVLIIVVIVAVLIALVWSSIVERKEAYEAWVKQTENPQGLTYSEWNALNRAEHPTPYR